MVTVIPRKITAVSVNGVRCDDNGNVTLPTDSTPTNNSTNYVTSGGVKAELDALSQRIGNAENPAQVWVDVPFTIPVNSWTSGANGYTAVVESSSILATSGVFVNYDSLDNAVTPITAEESTGEVTFTTETIPTGVISGTFRIIDSVNGIVPTERGGTGVAATSNDNLLTQLGAAKQSDMTTAQIDIQNLTALVGNIDSPAQTALEVPFSIATSGWSGSGPYTATINSSSIITNSIVLQPNITSGFEDLDITWSWQRNSNNSITFTVDNKPSNTVAGTIPVVLSINGIVPLARGGTGIAANTNAELLAGLGAASTSALNTGLAGKQNTLTFDSTPTSGSTNPVTSEGVYAKIGAVGNTPLQTQISNLGNQTRIKTYTTLSQISVSSPASVADIYAALPEDSMLLVDGVEVSDLPNSDNYTIEFIKQKTARGHIIAYSKSNSNKIYDMPLNSSSNVPDGIWTSRITDNLYAIAAHGTTAPKAISNGQFVMVDGALFTAKTNIASGDTLSGNNLTAVSSGGLNALKAGLDTLNSNFMPNITSVTAARSGDSIVSGGYSKSGKIVCVNIRMSIGTAVSGSTTDLITGLPAYSGSSNNANRVACSTTAGMAYITYDGKLETINMPSGTVLVSTTYIAL